MAQGPSDTILVAITLRIQESKVRNPDPPDRRRFVLCECILVDCIATQLINKYEQFNIQVSKVQCRLTRGTSRQSVYGQVRGGGQFTGNRVQLEFSGGKHDVTEVESGVVDVAELTVQALCWVEVLEWQLDPL